MTRFVFALLFVGMGAAQASPPPPKEKAEEVLPPATEADWEKSANNLKHIGLAVHNYEGTYGVLPSDMTDAAGKPILSWRVQLLPYIEQQELYQQFKLNEAWDGPNNKPLLEKMPKIFSPVRVKAKPGMTYYQGFSGPDAFFDPKEPKLKINQIADGTSVTCLVIEAGTAVEWSKPGDIEFDPKKELPKLGGHFDGAFNMVLCDGSVMAVRKDYHAETMKNCITKGDGTVINLQMIAK